MRYQIFCSFIVFAIVASAEVKPNPPVDSNAKNTETAKKTAIKAEELTVTSDILEFDSANQRAIFTKNVKVVNNGTTMTSDNMTVYFDENNDPYLIIAENNVVITNGKTTSTSEKAVHKIPEQLIILSKNPQVFDGKNTIKARIITFHEAKRITEFEDPVCTLANQKFKLSSDPKK